MFGKKSIEKKVELPFSITISKLNITLPEGSSDPTVKIKIVRGSNIHTTSVYTGDLEEVSNK